MTEQPGYFSVIPAAVMFNHNLTDFEKILYGHISSLCNKEGFCWAKNRTFAKAHRKSESTISAAISKLEKLGFIKVEIDRIEGNKRKIWILFDALIPKQEEKEEAPYTKKLEDLSQDFGIPIPENKDTYTKKLVYINNKTNSKINTKEREGGRAPPSSLSKSKFASSFPEIEINCEFKSFHDVDLLIMKLNESQWLRTEGVSKGLSWLLSIYKKIITNQYKDNLSPKPSSQPEKNFVRHGDETYKSKTIFTNLNNVEF